MTPLEEFEIAFSYVQTGFVHIYLKPYPPPPLNQRTRYVYFLLKRVSQIRVYLCGVWEEVWVRLRAEESGETWNEPSSEGLEESEQVLQVGFVGWEWDAIYLKFSLVC